ncbi:uncharacterized protein LOC135123541 isoform X2 [Zophobas morio]|uniref:uncharacterized protein LOC135123541 isoform X2 n=1 Tax=Zophobas morio TaxID=2755281 RepID=UPI0030828C6D
MSKYKTDALKKHTYSDKDIKQSDGVLITESSSSFLIYIVQFANILCVKMRLPKSVVLLATCLPFVTSMVGPSFFEFSDKIFQITNTVFDTVITINNGNTTKDYAFSQMDLAVMQTDEMEGKMKEFNEAVKKISHILPNEARLKPNITDIRMKQNYLVTYYKDTVKYLRDFDMYANSTFINFATRVLSELPSSVTHMTRSIHQQIVKEDFIDLLLERLRPTGNGYFCKEKQSLQQLLHNFFNEILLMNTRSYITVNTAYIFKKLYTKGDFHNEITHAFETLKLQTNNLVAVMKLHLARASSELWRCDPNKHVSDETFIELRHFLRGIILNKANLDPNKACSAECDAFTYRKLPNKCNNDNAWCNKQQPCRKIINCHYIDSSMEVCPSKNINRENRRYEYVEFGNGRVFGKKKNCSTRLTYLATYIYWIVYRCSYCFCICDEYDKYSTERTINLRVAMSNTAGNKVVTGLRFVKHNRIIHLQVQEGKLLPFGQIDLSTVRWVPPEDYSIQNKNYHKNEDYHVFTWEERGVDLADIKAENGTVITGVQFKKVGTRIHLEVRLTPFNFTTGVLKDNQSFIIHDPNIQHKHDSGKELKLITTDIPTRSPFPSTRLTTDTYVQFTNTGYDKDAGQTTVPFFDAQPVESTMPVPLSGVGLFHKGQPGYGGFITPKILTYNFWKHLKPVFPLGRNKN